MIRLFWNFLMIGALSFGGGYGMISLVRETVLSNGWLTESEFLSFIAVSESTPGPLAVNMATFVGSSQGGFWGALVATLGVVLPSFLLLLLIAAVLRNLMKYRGVEAFLSGVRPRTNGTGTLQISAEDTQTRSAGEIYTALRQSLALVYADGNGGTAIVMTADGYLITNAHTVSGAESITVQLSDGMEYAAALSGMDESSDLAVLKIEPETALQPAEFGDSAGAAAGDTVYVFSHPFGAAFDNATMTDGSIAAVQSGVRIGAETLNVFQTDATPDSGSAGGPLVNEAGQVIGICIDHVGSYVSYQTVPELGFAIPISEAKTILDDLIVNGYVSGRVSLGLTVSEIPETYRRFWGLPSGVVIESVTAGSNAYYAGLHAGDVICQLGDSAVTNLNDYRSILSACHVGEELRVYIYRDGRQYYTDVTLTGKGESPSEIATEQMQNETE